MDNQLPAAAKLFLTGNSFIIAMLLFRGWKSPRVPTGLCLMVSKFVLYHIIRSHMHIGHDESVPVRESADVFWYALAHLVYNMVRASLIATIIQLVVLHSEAWPINTHYWLDTRYAPRILLVSMIAISSFPGCSSQEPT